MIFAGDALIVAPRITRAEKRGQRSGSWISIGNARRLLRHGKHRPNRLEWHVVERRRFARDAVVVHRVRTVGADFHIENGLLARAGDALSGDADRRQVFGKAMVVDLEVNEVADP